MAHAATGVGASCVGLRFFLCLLLLVLFLALLALLRILDVLGTEEVDILDLVAQAHHDVVGIGLGQGNGGHRQVQNAGLVELCLSRQTAVEGHVNAEQWGEGLVDAHC